MKFADKLRELRKQENMSQEALAAKLGVSRQAVTKWETDKGLPDISNFMELSALFGITVEELLSGEGNIVVKQEPLYESRTEYDMAGDKRIDMRLGGAKHVLLKGSDDEKILVRLLSRSIETVRQDFKVRIEDEKHRIDVSVNRMNKMTEIAAKDGLDIEVTLPNRCLNHLEMQANCSELRVANIVCENLEFSGRTERMSIEKLDAVFEVDCNLDMDISCCGLNGALELNQISATSVLHVPDDFAFRTVVKGIGNSISYGNGESLTEDFSNPDAESCIELNGMKSELKIMRGAALQK